MKVLFVSLVILAVITLLHCQKQTEDDSGLYVPDNSGQYVHDDSGRYIPDRSGDYRADGLGKYQNDNTGVYKDDLTGIYRGNSDNAYNEDFFRRSFVNQASKRNSNADNTQFSGISNINLLGAGSTVNSQLIKPISHKLPFGNIPAAASPIPVSTRYNPEKYVDGHWKIIRQSDEAGDDGYHWLYETENGITAEESGKLANKGTEKEGMKAKGFYQYTGPDNVLYTIGYTADENGYVAVGNHIPTPPPIPIEIKRSLEFLRSQGKL
ncbi:hypothetical protein FQA39_LY13748 [Lamprigera yunnana]|nr:hypothetical protein FQA39_LY13748 [Lamprigera yunnana]